MSHQAILWLIFIVAVPAALVIDLGYAGRRGARMGMRKALMWSAIWISLALSFNVLVYVWRGPDTAFEFLTGYLIEESLSVDNLFVFLMIFSYFGVDFARQRKVLFWGILGVIVTRGIFIFAGVTLIAKLHWLIYVLGAFLVFTGVKMALSKEREIHPEKNPVLKLFRRLMPVTDSFEGDRFFVRRDMRFWATPLFIVLLVIETTDIVFAVDSIPAVLAITQDPFVVYTSNIFAVLGLRALFFALAGFMQLFHFLNYGLSIVLAFVGVKMLISDFYKVPTPMALGFVAAVLILSVIASLIWPKKQ